MYRGEPERRELLKSSFDVKNGQTRELVALLSEGGECCMLQLCIGRPAYVCGMR